MNTIIKRRIQFLIDAAKDEDKKDQAISYVMRVLSNYATIGKDASSESIKKINCKVTEKAYILLKEKGIKKFCKETINEHPKPLEQTWQWLKENAHTLSVDDVWKEFCKYKMVTVTKEEDNYMKGRGLNSKGTVEQRYLNIKIINLPKPPFELDK